MTGLVLGVLWTPSTLDCDSFCLFGSWNHSEPSLAVSAETLAPTLVLLFDASGRPTIGEDAGEDTGEVTAVDAGLGVATGVGLLSTARTSFWRSLSPMRISEALRTRVDNRPARFVLGELVLPSSLVLEDLPPFEEEEEELEVGAALLLCGFLAGAFSVEVIERADIQSMPLLLSPPPASLLLLVAEVPPADVVVRIGSEAYR